MRVGQPVTSKSDLYGGKVRYHGTVAGFGAGTGSAFALLPAQNATGNWIKIVQRIRYVSPSTRTSWREYPLQIGLSMQVQVDTHQRDGNRLPQLVQATPSYTTSVYDEVDAATAQRIKAIIAANDHEVTKAGSASVATTNVARSSAAPVDGDVTARRMASGRTL
jgi:membrane fusion protein (multidrug efflux system)